MEREETDAYFYGMHLALVRATDRDIAIVHAGLGYEEKRDLELGLALGGRKVRPEMSVPEPLVDRLYPKPSETTPEQENQT